VRLPYQLLTPEEAGERHPLVLYLHGAGERGDDNQAQLAYLPRWLMEPGLRRRFPCFLLAPQCPAERRWGWVDWKAGRRRYAREPTEVMRAVRDLLEEVLDRYPIDADRVYLTGLSMGGFGAWELATRLPGRFAAVAPICGGGDATAVAPLVGLPLWAWHGADDEVVLPERSREMIAALRAAGGSPRYTELPGVGHDAWTPAYTGPELLPWLFARRRSR
jgi:predicted peptidase